MVALNRSLPLQQWASLPVLAAGVAIVNLSSRAVDAAAAHSAGREPHFALGLAAALAAACFSGYASVYVERLLKTERLSWAMPPASPPTTTAVPGASCGEPLLVMDDGGGSHSLRDALGLSPRAELLGLRETLGRRGSISDVFSFGLEREAAEARGRLAVLME